MSGYEVIIQPVLLVALALTVLVVALRGISRVDGGTREVDGVDVAVRKLAYSGRSLRRATTIAIVGALALSALVVTPPGRRGVIYTANGGVNAVERAEGFSFIIPLLQTAIQMDVREQKFFTDEAFSQSADLQEITVHVSVNYSVNPGLAAELYQNVGKGYEDTIIKPAIFQLVKSEVGQILAEDFALQRNQIAIDIGEALAIRLAPEGIDVTFVSIEDAVFDPAFITSVKNKVIADQIADEQQRLVAAETARKLQVIQQAQAAASDIRIRAAAQAEANDLLDASLTADIILWQRILRWDGILPATLITGSDADVLLEVGS